ncbi:MAG: hypothetical protein KJZ78_08860 [Bryobacteraceae bacterium]|nr:hypothetical protein [Bryobacteraceae bacterium]
MPEQPENEAPLSQVTVVEVHGEFEKLLKDRRHMGVRNFLGDAFLEPRNPFQRTRRKPQRVIVAVVGILLLGFLIVYGFHLR